MKSTRNIRSKVSVKAPAGIAGFDEITRGGLPRGSATLLMGGPGSGKTVLALQFLAHGAGACTEPGIFVAFEEHSKSVIANARSFGWKLEELRTRKKLFLLDAQPKTDLLQAGSFDLCGLLAVLEAQVRVMKARRIVFDALDVVLALMPDATARRREIYRLHEWLLAQKLTAIITVKSDVEHSSVIMPQCFGFMQFMVDCVVLLNHEIVSGVSQRNLRVLKYRGSGFDENETPFLITACGFEVGVVRPPGPAKKTLGNHRISSGIERLDTLLCGGYLRGASVLITGHSGTAKTTMSALFAEAACKRGERTLFVSFDTDCNEVIRNLESVNIRLASFIKSDELRMISARSITGSAETYLMHIKAMAKEHGARAVVIDPVSTWYKSGNGVIVQSVADRLIDWAKIERITLVCTSLFDEMSNKPETNSTLQISTLADTWIHLNYLVQAGERNRGLSIIKSRGTAHSNQMSELILADSGVTLNDIYAREGEVFMGTLRREMEHNEMKAHVGAEVAAGLKHLKHDDKETELAVRMKTLQLEQTALHAKKELLNRVAGIHRRELRITNAVKVQPK